MLCLRFSLLTRGIPGRTKFCEPTLHKETTSMTDLELQSQETEALLKTSERPKKRALAIQLVALCGAAALAGAALASRAGANEVVVTKQHAPTRSVRASDDPNPAPPPPAHTSNYSPLYG